MMVDFINFLKLCNFVLCLKIMLLGAFIFSVSFWCIEFLSLCSDLFVCLWVFFLSLKPTLFDYKHNSFILIKIQLVFLFLFFCFSTLHSCVFLYMLLIKSLKLDFVYTV